MYSHPRAGGQPMRPTRPTGLVPIDTHALNASTHHGLRLQGIPLPSAPSTPSQAGPALPSKTGSQQELARAEGRKRQHERQRVPFLESSGVGWGNGLNQPTTPPATTRSKAKRVVSPSQGGHPFATRAGTNTTAVIKTTPAATWSIRCCAGGRGGCRGRAIAEASRSARTPTAYQATRHPASGIWKIAMIARIPNGMIVQRRALHWGDISFFLRSVICRWMTRSRFLAGLLWPSALEPLRT